MPINIYTIIYFITGLSSLNPLSMSCWHARLSSMVLSWSIIAIITGKYSVGMIDLGQSFRNMHKRNFTPHTLSSFLSSKFGRYSTSFTILMCSKLIYIWLHYNDSQVWDMKHVNFTTFFWWGSHRRCLCSGMYPTGMFCAKWRKILTEHQGNRNIMLSKTNKFCE